MCGDTGFLSRTSKSRFRTYITCHVLQTSFLQNPECETRYTPPKPSGFKTLFLTTTVYTVNSVSLWTLCCISLPSSFLMKHHMLYNKIVYCYDVAIYFPASIHRRYICAMFSVHYLSSCTGHPLSWEILIIPKATKKLIYSTVLPCTAPLLCDICYYSE